MTEINEQEHYRMAVGQEIERLKSMINEMSLMIGILRGLIFSFQKEFNQEQYDSLKRVDRQIEKLFYKGSIR